MSSCSQGSANIIQLKRQHSVESITAASPAPAKRHSPTSSTTPVRDSSPTKGTLAPHATPENNAASSSNLGPLLPSVAFSSNQPPGSTTTASNSIGSPLKKARSSLSGIDDEDMRKRFGLGIGGVNGINAGGGIPQADVLGRMEHDRLAGAGQPAARDAGNVGPSLGGLLGGVLGNKEQSRAAPMASNEGKQIEIKREKDDDMEEEL